MTTNEFLTLLERLTGSAPKRTNARDHEHLSTALGDDTRLLDASQFNELVLLANKDRVTAAFFSYFFCSSEAQLECSIGDLAAGVTKFQKAAMLCFGNFIYGYRLLSKLKTVHEIATALGRNAESQASLRDRYRKRRPSILDVTAIKREDTYLVGYLSARELGYDRKRSEVLQELLRDSSLTEWAALDAAIGRSYGSEPKAASEARATREFASRLHAMLGAAAKPGDGLQLVADALKKIETAEKNLQAVRDVATRNTDVYLTWDHMDVYFATSMRKKWEYEDLYDFVSKLMAREELKDLNLRYFDPTQSFDEDRINKGLVEALMLKRASCTVYSIQDTDTLGKDSELAATLAQGKPVIAYAPAINVADRTKQLAHEAPLALGDRLEFVLYHDELSRQGLEGDSQLRAFRSAVQAYQQRSPWRSLPQADAEDAFRERHHDLIHRACSVIAGAEERIYNSRASTLQEAHPLGIQVHLETGVANGVLVARDVETCAKLLRQLLTNSLEFEIDVNKRFWLLKEKLTGSVFRLVSRDKKLTNCFWNFYRSDLSQGSYNERP